MDNQKFRVNLTIYHTNGAVLSPTSIVFSGARLERLQKALAMISDAAEGLWDPDKDKIDGTMVQTNKPALPVEKISADAEPKCLENRVKGLLFVRCLECRNRFVTVLRDWVSELECSCGHKIQLGKDNTARFEFTCKSCGRVTYGRTNIDEAAISAGSISYYCGEPGPELIWRPDIREYREKDGT